MRPASLPKPMVAGPTADTEAARTLARLLREQITPRGRAKGYVRPCPPSE